MATQKVIVECENCGFSEKHYFFTFIKELKRLKRKKERWRCTDCNDAEFGFMNIKQTVWEKE